MTLPPETPEPAPNPGTPFEATAPGPPPPAVPTDAAPGLPDTVRRRRGPGPVVGLVLAIALVGGAVGGILVATSGNDETGAGRPLAPIPSGWTTHALSSEGFRLGLPPGWQDVSSERVDEAFDQLRSQNPELARVLEEQVKTQLASLVRFFAYDTRSPTLAEDFATNVNVVVEPVPAGISFDRYLDANVAQLQKLPGIDISIESRNVALPGGRSAIIRSRFSLNSPAGAQEIAVTQYVMLKGRRGFILSMTTTPKHASTYATVFAEIAATFQPL